MYNVFTLLYPENVRRRSFAQLELQGDASADQHLPFAISMFTGGSHQVIPIWNHISQWLMPVVLFLCMVATVSNIAVPMATSECKPEMKTN